MRYDAEEPARERWLLPGNRRGKHLMAVPHGRRPRLLHPHQQTAYQRMPGRRKSAKAQNQT